MEFALSAMPRCFHRVTSVKGLDVRAPERLSNFSVSTSTFCQTVLLPCSLGLPLLTCQSLRGFFFLSRVVPTSVALATGE